MDSIELGISEECELRSCSRSVGAYGKVDEKGKSSLDAMIMDGFVHNATYTDKKKINK